MSAAVKNPFEHIVEPLDPKDPKQQFFNLSKLGDPRYGRSTSTLNANVKHLVGAHNQEVFTCTCAPQTVCRSPSGSSWNLLSGTVMSF